MLADAPLLPLEHFRETIGFNPWHFWGWSDSNYLRPTSSCDPVTSEYEWQQSDAIGRVEIAQALVECEHRLFDYLGYEIAPRFKETTLPWPRLIDRRMGRLGPYDADGRWLNVKLPDAYVSALGVETRTLLGQSVPIVFTDPDGDGLPEVATLGPIATTVTNPAEIALYYSAGDRLGIDTDLSERWRITPIKATISGGFVTIKAAGYLFMKPALREGFTQPQTVDPGVSTNFVSGADVYRRYTDSTVVDVTGSQGVVIWETRPYHGWWCQCGACGNDPYSGSVDDPAATAQAAARVGIRDAHNGQVIPAEAVYNASTGIWSALNWDVCEEPDRVLIRYSAGYPLDSNGWVSLQWRTIVARYAAAEISRPICGCDDANRALFYWQQDLSRIGNTKDLFATNRTALNNPLGTRRGHVYAWNQINTLMMTGGMLLI